jgi:hypothetical protein
MHGGINRWRIGYFPTNCGRALAVRELSTMQDDPQQLHLLEFSGSLPQT